MLRKIAIVVASGTGSRMNSEVPKQYLPLGGVPILVHTLRKFLAIHDCEIVLAIAADGVSYWEKVAKEYFNGENRIRYVIGGETRYESVKNAIASLEVENDAVVAIHDGVRPFVSLNGVLNSFITAEAMGSAVASVDSKDSVRLIQDDLSNRAIERNKIKMIQTPQTFRYKILKDAYDTPYSDLFTDDASVVESKGHEIHLIEGSYKNIKITTPEDLIIGEAYLKSEQ